MYKMNLKKIDRKKILLLVVIGLLVLALAVSGILYLTRKPEDEEPSLQQTLFEKLTAYETDLRDSLGSLDNNEAVTAYLLGWAKNKEIPADVDSVGNVIFSRKANKGYANEQPTVLLCSFNADQMENYIEEMAVALCVAKNARNHGKLTVIFMPCENDRQYGAEGLNLSRFARDAAVFCLGHSADSKVSTVTGGYERYRISHKLSYVNTDYDAAFKIRIRHCPTLPLTGNIGQTPNPIKTLGDLLANFKSTSLLFELSGFAGGSDAVMTPSWATMTVVINQSDVEKFTRRMDNAIEKFYDRYQEDYPQIEYTYTETKLPKRVIADEDTDNLVSLMYTAIDGVYQRSDEGNVMALTNIGKISCADHRLRINVDAMSDNAQMMEEIEDSYETICGLCDVTYRRTTRYPIFDSTDASASLLQEFETAFLDFTGDREMLCENTVEFTPCALLQQKEQDLPMLYCAITENTKHKFSGALVTYLDRSSEEEQE